MPPGAVAEGRTELREGGTARRGVGSWGDELRNAFAFGVMAAVYALMAGGLFHLVRPAAPGAVLRAFGMGYALAAGLFLGAHGGAWVVLRLLAPGRRAALLPLVAPLVSLIAGAAALPRLFTADDLAELVGAATFLGAALALSTTHDFYARFQRQLVPARRVRDFLAARPGVGDWLLRSIRPLLAFGRLVPWLIGGIVLLALPPALRERIGSYVLLLTLLAHLINRKLLEELAVWVFLHALRVGDYLHAAQLPVRPSRLGGEIEAAPDDLEAPFAQFIAYGMEGPEGLALTPVALGRLVPVYLGTYGLAARGEKPEVSRPAAERERVADLSLVRRLVERGVRFRVEAEPAAALEPLPLPRWTELPRDEARERLAALYPGEPLWHAIARLYETPIRGLLLPVALLWLPLLAFTLALVGRGHWVLPLVGAALSFGLLVWLTMFYGNWVFDQSLRRRDFRFLARQLGDGRMRGELEDALGARNPLLRARAVELLLFDDDIARLGITVPPAGLRKFLRRAG